MLGAVRTPHPLPPRRTPPRAVTVLHPPPPITTTHTHSIDYAYAGRPPLHLASISPPSRPPNAAAAHPPLPSPNSYPSPIKAIPNLFLFLFVTMSLSYPPPPPGLTSLPRAHLYSYSYPYPSSHLPSPSRSHLPSSRGANSPTLANSAAASVPRSNEDFPAMLGAVRSQRPDHSKEFGAAEERGSQ